MVARIFRLGSGSSYIAQRIADSLVADAATASSEGMI